MNYSLTLSILILLVIAPQMGYQMGMMGGFGKYHKVTDEVKNTFNDLICTRLNVKKIKMIDYRT